MGNTTDQGPHPHGSTQLSFSNTVRTSTVVYSVVLLPGSITPTLDCGSNPIYALISRTYFLSGCSWLCPTKKDLMWSDLEERSGFHLRSTRSRRPTLQQLYHTTVQSRHALGGVNCSRLYLWSLYYCQHNAINSEYCAPTAAQLHDAPFCDHRHKRRIIVYKRYDPGPPMSRVPNRPSVLPL